MADTLVFRLRDSITLPLHAGVDGIACLRSAHERWGPGMRLERGRMQHRPLFLVVAGTGSYASEGTVWPLGAGSAFTFHERHVVVTCAARQSLEVRIMSLAGTHAHTAVRDVLGTCDHPVDLAEPEPAIVALTRLHDEACARRPGWERGCDLLAHLALLAVARARSTAAAGHAPAFLRLRAAIASTALTATPLAVVAQRCGLSAAAASRLFRAATGESAVAFRTRLRISRATELLADPDQTLAAVAAHVGYADAFAFSKAFRRIMGCAPHPWRATLTR